MDLSGADLGRIRMMRAGAARWKHGSGSHGSSRATRDRVPHLFCNPLWTGHVFVTRCGRRQPGFGRFAVSRRVPAQRNARLVTIVGNNELRGLRPPLSYAACLHASIGLPSARAVECPWPVTQTAVPSFVAAATRRQGPPITVECQHRPHLA